MKLVGKWFGCLLAAILLFAELSTVAPQHASAAGNTYYVDAASGSDTTGNGSSGSPWKTIGKAASAAAAGDTVKIRSGTYRESVRPANSGTTGNPITFQPDTGANVTVSGADLVTGTWTAYSGNTYKTTATLTMGDFLDSVYVDGVANYLARSPNTPVGDLYDPYTYKVEYPGTDNSGITDTTHLTQPNGTWDNAAIFIRDSYAWGFGGALGTSYSTGRLNLKTWQSAYNLELSSYDNSLKLIGPSGSVLGSYAVTVTPNTTYNLKVSASGNNFNVYLNNGPSPVISVTDYAQVEGSFGLGVESNSSATAATAQFTNVNATIASQNPNQPTGRLAPNFTSNLDGWTHEEGAGFWKEDGTALNGYTQPSMSTTNTWYYTNTTAKDFTYSADVKLTSASGGNVYLQFRKEDPPRNVYDISYNDYYMNTIGLSSPEYYIMGSLAALDYPGEWYYDRSAGQLYLQTTSGDTPANHTIEVKARNLAFDLSDRSNIVIKGLNLFAATIDMANGDNDVVDGIHAKYLSEFNKAVSYSTGICLCGTNDTLMNSELQYSSGELVTLKGTNNRVINNKIHDGTYGPITYTSAINILGSGHLISNNEVYNAGKMLIGGDFYGTVIQYNDFHDANYFSTDTGLLYVAHDGMGNSEIHHNYWHGSGYRYNGANGVQGDWDAGIYIDEHASDVLIYDNVIWDMPWRAINVNHMADNVLIYNNTTYDKSIVDVNLYNSDAEGYGIRAANNISLDGFNTGATAYGAQFDHNMAAGSPDYVDAAGHDFQLQSGSDAIDAGTPVRGITTGYAGAAPDAGAYEYGGTGWTAGANLASPPSPLPTYQLVDTDYKNLLVNGRLALNRIQLPSMDSLFGWNKTDSMTAQPAFDYSGGKLSSHYQYETGISLGTGADGIEQTITGLQPNTTYEIRGFIRAGASGQSVRLGVKNYGGTDTYQTNSSTTWAEEKFTFTTGSTNTSATIYGYKPTTGGYAFVDDVSVVATTAVSGGSGSTGGGYAEDFESTAIGSMPAGWTTNASGGAVSVQQAADGANTTNHALTLAQTTYGVADVSAGKTFDPLTGTAVVKTRLRADQTNGLGQFTIMDSAGTTVAQFGFMTSGKFGYVDPVTGWVDTSASYAANQWYDVQTTVDLAAGTYDVEIDGTPVLSNMPVVNTTTDIAQILFGTNMWYIGTYHYDNVQAGTPAIYGENFESTAIGSMPAGWTTNASGGSVSVQQAADGANTTNHALTLAQTTYGVADVSAGKTFDPLTGTAVVSTRMRADQTNGLGQFTIMDSAGTTVAQFGFMTSGKFGYVDPVTGWVDTSASYAANQWYDVQTTVDLAAGTYDVEIDGSPVLSNVPVVNTTTDIAQILFGTNMWFTGTYHFDNIEVTP